MNCDRPRGMTSAGLPGYIAWMLIAVTVLPSVLTASDDKSSPRKAAAGSSSNSASSNSATSNSTAATKRHPLELPLKYARSSLKSVQQVKDYRANFSKHDIVDGRVYAHTTFIKFRAKPMSIYMKFTEPHKGREVIYVHGKNDGKLLAHETGLASLIGTVALLPTSARAMSESKHPITEMGMEKLVQGIIDIWEAERKYGEIDVKHFPNARIGKRQCVMFQATHPRPRKQFKFHKSQLWIDRQTGLPVRVAHWGFPTKPGDKIPLLEEYTYRNVKLNIGLKDIDFDVDNPKYNY